MIRILVVREFLGHQVGDEVEVEVCVAKMGVRLGNALYADGLVVPIGGNVARQGTPDVLRPKSQDDAPPGRRHRCRRAAGAGIREPNASASRAGDRLRDGSIAPGEYETTGDGGRQCGHPGPYALAPAWWPDWRGQACVIVASGPSAPDAGVERARTKARFLAVNDSWKLAPWADALYATDFRWWRKYQGVPEFGGLKLCQDTAILIRDGAGRVIGTQWGVRKIEVTKIQDSLVVHKFGLIGWGGNSGFGALNLAVQFGANPIVLVGYDMRIDLGMHWHGLHGGGLTNPHARNVDRWRRCVDGCAPMLQALGIRVFNASSVSSLKNYPKMDLMEALDERAERAA